MRILHAIKSLDPAAGGPQVVAPRLVAAQAALGCEVPLVTYRLRAREAVANEALEHPVLREVRTAREYELLHDKVFSRPTDANRVLHTL